jgi:hypothetical protein
VSLLVAIGVNSDGYREILGICEGAKEDEAGWSGFLRHLKERGRKGVRLIISDAGMGLAESANPLGWLVYSIGLVARCLKIALVFAPIMIAGYAMGLPYGPQGVAFAYSAVMTLWVIPHILWCVHGTVISLRDILLTVSPPLASGILARGLALCARLICGQSASPLPRLVLESSVLLVTFYGALLFAAGQKSLYLGSPSRIEGPSSSSVAEKISVSV